MGTRTIIAGLALGSALGLGLASAAAAASPDRAAAEDAVIKAERDFAADAAVRGVGPSFSTWAAPEGIVLTPNPTNARAVYGARTNKPGEPVLKWWPLRVGVAASGDLAFDTGPWVTADGKASGWFLTLWKRQPDGAWRWVLDHGADAAPPKSGPETPVARLSAGKGNGATALTRVQAEDAALAAETARGGLAAAYGRRLSPGAWIAGPEGGVAMTETEVAKALAGRPQILTAEPLGGEASKAGDLAYTYGKAHWTGAGGKAVEGRYVRVWQAQAPGWRIVFDMVTAD
jgi:ketosteroid isomerase-like protein